jgi:predicted permease
MRIWHLLITRLRSLLFRQRTERELDEELRLHFERELERLVAQGVPPEQARSDLRSEFGHVTQIKEQCRDARGLTLLEQTIGDVRYGARSLLRTPGFVITVVLTLALGIGANTAIFSVVYGVLWKPLPLNDSDRVAALWMARPAASSSGSPTGPMPASSRRTRTGWQGEISDGRVAPELAPADFVDIRAQSRVFERVAGAAPWGFVLTGEGEPVRLRGWQVSRGFFETAGVGALLGRTFVPEDHFPGAKRIIVLSYRAWNTYFGGDPQVVGAAVRLDDVRSNIVGVMPEGFDLPVGGYYSAVDMWTPQPDNAPALRGRESAYWPVMVRLAPGARWEQAQQELDGIGARLAELYPLTNSSRRFRAVPIREHLVGTLRSAVLVMAGAVALVLLTACANVACLLLMRRSQRRRELAVRLALGAGRGRIARQLMMEHAMLAVAGTVLGVALAYGLIPMLLALNPATSPLFSEVRLDRAALIFSLVLCAVTAILFGLAPALRFASSESWRGLELGTPSVGENRRAQRIRGVLVVSQIGLSVALLAGAGLLARTFDNLLSIDPGLRTEHILSAQASFFGAVRDDPASVAVVRDMIAKMRSLPGVVEAAGVSNLPMHDTPVDYRGPFSIENQPASPGQPVRQCLNTIVTPGYFQTAGIALESGRFFDEHDLAGAERVIVINRTMARLWRGENPLGAKVRLAGFPVNGAIATVVGVARDVVHTRPDADPEPEAYLPHAQVPVRLMTFVLRTSVDSAALAPPVRNILREALPTLPVGQIETMEHFRSESLRPERFNAIVLGAFAGSALLLAAIGLYGVIGYLVALRIPEFGLRFALGAQRSDILQSVFVQGLTLVGAGIVLGLALAFVGNRMLSSMLFRVGLNDPVTYVAISGVTIAVACLACLIPARRASLVDPVSALRNE